MNRPESKMFQKCKIILLTNLLCGFCLFKCNPRKKTKWWHFVLCVLQSFYELVLNVAIFSMTTMVGWVVLTGSNHSRGNFAAFINSVRGILFATYITFSSLFLRFGKKQLRKILRETESIMRKDRFSDFQEQCLVRASRRTFSMYFLLPLTVALLSVALNFALTVLCMLGYYEDSVFNLEDDDKEKIYSSIEPFSYLKILIILIFCYLKQAAHDSVFLHLYCFVAEELRILKHLLRNLMKAKHTNSLLPDGIDPQVTLEIDILSWIEFQQILARLMRKINSFSYPYILVLAGYNSGILCITAYLFSKLSDSPAFKFAVFGYMMNSVVRISLFCEAGQRLKKQGLEICDVIYKAPVLNAPPNFGIALHSIALDCQRSFVARGGPFFTLSVEFFTSVVGAVLTYFVVLIQFK